MRLAVILLFFTASSLAAQSLNQVLETVRKNSLSYKSEQANYRAKTAEAGVVDQAYDWHLTVDAQNVRDNTEMNNRFSGDQRLQKNVDIQIKKQFFTGTQVSLGYKRQWQDTLFPAPTPPTTLPDGTVVPGQDPSTATIYNPAYFNTVRLMLVQPLWRNLMAEEVELQRKALDKAAEIPRYASLIKLQADQYRAEKLYWAIIALNKRIYVLDKLVKKAKEFAKQMKTRVRMGRAENVELADAEARVLDYETRHLDLQIKRDDLRMQLSSLMYENKKTRRDVRIETGSLLVPDLQLKFKDAKTAVQFAENSRLDLRLNIARQKIAQTQIQAAKEEGAWDISLYALTEVNGIDTNQSDSMEKVEKTENVMNVIGVKLDIPLGGNSSSKAKMVARYHEKAALEIERRSEIKAIDEELEIAYLTLSGARKKVDLIEKQIASLEKKKDEEARKLRHARSEPVAVIRYEMEVLAAELELIAALELQRGTEANIRHLIHGYPARNP